jgi:tetratricopeptide (TPR) repeat protein
MLPSRFTISVGPRPTTEWVDTVQRDVAAGRFSEAIETLRKALAAEPSNARILNELGHVRLLAGQPREAVDPLRRAVALDPRLAVAHLRLGSALERLGDAAGAAKAYEQAATLQPSLAEAHYRLAVLHHNNGRPQPALISFRRAAQAATQIDLRQMAEARALTIEGHEESAAPLLRAVLGRQPANAPALGLLGDILAGLGQFEEAERCFEGFLALQPAKVETFYNIVRCRRITAGDGDLIERMDAALQSPRLTDLQRSPLQLARGKSLEDLGRYGEAMAAFDDASEARARSVPFDLGRFVGFVDSLVERFDARALSRTYPGASDDPTPTFILGMPRSGTTLCEHILCAHPQAAGPGELQFWTTFGPTLEAAGPRSLEGRFVGDAAAYYLRYLRAISGEAARIIDKTPLNFLWIGLIHIVFPRSTIIHCRRRPIDTAISIHQTAFAPGLDLPTGGDDLVGYFRQYQRLMAHWRAVLPPGRVLEVDYETLTASPDGDIRRIVAHAGLEWADACLRSHDSDRAVRTPSRWQVRQPINTGSVDRWRRYEPYLGALAALRDASSLG